MPIKSLPGERKATLHGLHWEQNNVQAGLPSFCYSVTDYYLPEFTRKDLFFFIPGTSTCDCLKY